MHSLGVRKASTGCVIIDREYNLTCAVTLTVLAVTWFDHECMFALTAFLTSFPETDMVTAGRIPSHEFLIRTPRGCYVVFSRLY